MAEVRWIKIVTDIFSDEKIRFIETLPQGDTIALMWFKLMCLAGRSNNGGFLTMTDRIPYTDEMLASIFARDVKIVRLALDTFCHLEMIEIVENTYFLTNWEKHQSAEKLQTIREQNALRAQNYRARKIEERHANSVTRALRNRDSSVIVTQQNKILDKDLEKEKEIVTGDSVGSADHAPKESRFQKPTVEQVQEYCESRGNGIDPQYWMDYYEANGWICGKTHMKDWKAAVRKWEHNDKVRKNATAQTGHTFARMEDFI